MEPILWNESFSVGVQKIDGQHKKLIGMINRLIEEQKQLTEQSTIAELLTEMTDYAREHFRTEEYLMAEYGYEAKDVHARLHGEFVEKTQEFITTDAGPNYLSRALLEYLKTWLVSHILNEDMKYRAFFAAKGVS